jgi:antitoxin component YwqK of YwqJK toxin-antitoxin module
MIARFCYLLFFTLIAAPVLAKTQYMDVNLYPTKVKVNRTYHYSSDTKPDENGIYTIAVFDKQDALIATLKSTKPVVSKGTLTGTLVAQERKAHLISRLLYHFNDGFSGQVETRDSQGYLQKVTPYKNSKRDGIEKEYYSNGALKAYSPYKAGKLVHTSKKWNKAGLLISKTERNPEGKFIKRQKWTNNGDLLKLIVPVDIPNYAPGLKETAWRYDRTETFIASSVRDPDRGFTRGARHPYKLIEKSRDGKIFEAVEENGSGNNGMQRFFLDGYEQIEHRVNGELDGEYSQKNEGKLTTGGTYKAGMKVGDWQETNKDGTVTYEHYSKQGKREGKRTVYDPDSEQLLESEFYRNDKKHGQYQRFDKQGNKITYGQYTQGKKTGPWVEYDYPDQWQGHYKQGKKEGQWSHRNALGYLIAKQTYRDGLMTGPQYIFSNDGALVLFEIRNEGIRDGISITFPLGQQRKVRHFKRGLVQSETD